MEIIRPLKGHEVAKLLPDTTIVTYSELKYINDINKLLGKNKQFVVLYQETEMTGHWTCVFAYGNTLTFFDSYGLPVDSLQLKGVPENVIISQNEDKSYLKILMNKSGYKIINHNDTRYQGKNVSTCGRHVVVRLYMKKLNNGKYKDFIFSFDVKPDILVTIITENVLKGFPTDVDSLKQLLKK